MADHPLVALVDKATSEYLIQTDWGTVLQICDTLNRESGPYACREVIKQTTKRMKEKKTRIALYTLELVETLVKNCECVHPYVGGKEFQAEIIKLIQNKKTKEPVKEKALDLVQFWAESFRSRRDLPLFGQTESLLRRAGIPFPPRRTNEPPLVFKSAPNPVETHHHSSNNSRSQSDQQASSMKEFSSIQESVNLAMEMLAYTNPEEEDPSTNEILRDLINTCKEAMPNVRSTIESGNFSSESQMVGLLALNDELVKVQEMFEDLVSRRQLFLTHGPSPTKKQQPVAAQQNNILDLAEAFGSLNPPSAPAHHHTHHNQPPAQPAPSRPFDELDFLSGMPSQPLTAAPATTLSYPYPAQPQPQQMKPQAQPFMGTTTPTYSANIFSAPPTSNVPIRPVQPVQQTQSTGNYLNPFMDTAPKPAQQPSSDGFDEFDMLASRHSATLPSPMQPAPSKPAATTQSLYFPPAGGNTASNPYNMPTTLAGQQHSSMPSLTSQQHSSMPNLAAQQHSSTGSFFSTPLATSPTGSNPYTNPVATLPTGSNPYMNPRATSPTANPYQQQGSTGSLYNTTTAPRATSPYGQPLATSPTNYMFPTAQPTINPTGYPQVGYGQPTGMGMQPLQPTPLQPMVKPNVGYQPATYNTSLPAGGYRPQQ